MIYVRLGLNSLSKWTRIHTECTRIHSECTRVYNEDVKGLVNRSLQSPYNNLIQIYSVEFKKINSFFTNWQLDSYCTLGNSKKKWHIFNVGKKKHYKPKHTMIF